jgi:hypothetical protein
MARPGRRWRPASPETGTFVKVELGLKASNGLRAQLETADDETVTLELRRKGHLVSYEAQGEVTEEGLKVRFGRLGLVDAAFTSPPLKLNSATVALGGRTFDGVLLSCRPSLRAPPPPQPGPGRRRR